MEALHTSKFQLSHLKVVLIAIKKRIEKVLKCIFISIYNRTNFESNTFIWYSLYFNHKSARMCTLISWGDFCKKGSKSILSYRP